ncbi:MAG: hypothetical protein C0404_08780 [Verrucomicrobia bacterium]|nr:hypothetical protein [Verrucomicrobiota bacterium]
MAAARTARPGDPGNRVASEIAFCPTNADSEVRVHQNIIGNGMKRGQCILYRLARWTVAVSVAASPLMFGGAAPWAGALLGLGVFAGAILWVFSIVCYPGTRIRAPILTLLLLLLLGYAMLQQVRLPFESRGLNPASVDAAVARNELLSRIGLLDSVPTAEFGKPDRASLSVSPAATEQAAGLLLVYLCAFLVVANCARRWHHIKSISLLLVCVGFIMAVMAIAQKLSGSMEILWFHVPRYGGNVFGTFSNRNHFAFHLTMMFGLALGVFFSSGGFLEMKGLRDWRERLAWLSSKRASKLALLAFALAMIGGAVALSVSRGAITGLMGGAAVVGLAGILRGKDKGRTKVVATVLLMAAAVVTWIGWQPIIGHYAELASTIKDPLADTRIQATQDTFKILGAFPMFGPGFGTFEYVFPMFARDELDFGRWLHAHNDVVQFMAEGGMIGIALICLCLVGFAARIWRDLPHAVWKVRAYMTGVMIGGLAVCFHSFVDYSLHKPANALLFAVICGIALAGAGLRSAGSRRDEDENGCEPWIDDQVEEGDDGLPEPAARSVITRLVAMLVMTMLVMVFVARLGEFRGEMAYARFEYGIKLVEKLDSGAVMERAMREAVDEASMSVCMNPAGVDNLVDAVPPMLRWAMNDKLPLESRAELADNAVGFAVLAVYVAPTDYLRWLWLARTQALVGRWDEAELCFERARKLKPHGKKLELFPN